MRRWGVVLGSVAFHALLVLLFVLDLARKPVSTPQPVMVVSLERAPIPPRARPSAQARGAPRGVSTKADLAPVAPVAAPAGPASPSASEGVAAASPAPSLAGLGGCRLATLDRLPAEARARCQEQLAQAMDAGRAPRPNLDPTGRYVRDARPYLTRPPKNGCKPVGVIQPGLLGASEAKLGVGCAWSF